jgi:hypothetical protein
MPNQAGLGTLGVTAALFLSGILNRLLPVWRDAFWDPHEPLVWLRYAAVLVCYARAVATAFVLMIEGLEHSSCRLSDALQRERWERTQREAAQRALQRRDAPNASEPAVDGDVTVCGTGASRP